MTPADDASARWYSVEDASALLGLSTPTIRRRIRAGGPPFTLRDGSEVPVISEQLTRPQGSYFLVKLPTALEAASTEEPTEPADDSEGYDESAPTRHPSAPVIAGASDASRTARDASSVEALSAGRQASSRASVMARQASDGSSDGSGDPSSDVVARLLADLVARSEEVGGLRATLDRTLRDLEASRDELARVTDALEASHDGWGARLAVLEEAARRERELRLVAEAALVALTERERHLEARERDVAAREARAASRRSWWRWLVGWLGLGRRRTDDGTADGS